MAISVLIIDDDKQKTEKIKGALVECGTEEAGITICHCVSDGRNHLRTNQYDLLIIDIALPERDFEDPVFDGGVKLLDQMLRRAFKKPSYVVGITGYEQIKREHDSFFSEHLWTLIKTYGDNNEWLVNLVKNVEYIIDSKSPPQGNDYGTDVFVVAALRTTELFAMKDIDLKWGNPSPLDHASQFYQGQFQSGGRNFNISIGAPAKVGLVHTALYVQKVINCLKPRYIAMTGICGGVRGSCEIGDVLLANPAWGWESGKYDEVSGRFKIEPDQVSIPDFIVSRFENLSEDVNFSSTLWNTWRGHKPPLPPKLRVSPIASGSSVVADNSIVEVIREQHRKVIGIEMEIYGLYASALGSSQPKPTFLATKSISDFCDSEKNDNFQDYAAYLSANTLVEFFKRYYSEIVDLAGRA